MTEAEKDAEIGCMAIERAALKRTLICMDNKVGRYQWALSQASVAPSLDAPLRENGDGVIVPAIGDLHEGESERELPGFPAIVELQVARRRARQRLKELDDVLDGLGIS